MTGLRSVWGVPGVPRLLAAQMCTVFGDTALILTLAVWTAARTGSASAAAMTVFAATAGTTVAPAAGRLVARTGPRRATAWANLGAAAVVVLLLPAGRGPFWLVYPLAGLYAAAGSVGAGALTGLLAGQVPAPLRVPVNAEFQSVHQLLRVVSPVAGVGLWEAGGPALTVPVVAGALVLGAALVWRDAAGRTRSGSPGRGAGGYRQLWSDRRLRRVGVPVVAGLCAQGVAQTPGFLVIRDSLHRPAGFIAVFVTIQSLAGVLATRVGVLRRTRAPDRLVRTGLLLAGAGYAVLLLPGLPPALAAFVLVGAGLPWIRVGWTSALQQDRGAAAASRVALAGQSLLGAAQTASIAAGALLGVVAGWRVLATTMVVVLLGAAVVPGRGRRRDRG